MQVAPSASLCSASFTARAGARRLAPRRPLLRKGIIAASGYLAQMWAQAPVCICLLWQAWHNTLDFASKVVCHETPARFLWILPVMILPAYFLPRCPLWSRRHDRLLAGRPWPAGWHDPGRAADQPPPGRSAQQVDNGGTGQIFTVKAVNTVKTDHLDVGRDEDSSDPQPFLDLIAETIRVAEDTIVVENAAVQVSVQKSVERREPSSFCTERESKGTLRSRQVASKPAWRLSGSPAIAEPRRKKSSF